MKIRSGFVSNSSSTSFIVRSEKDIELIRKAGCKGVHGYCFSDIKRVVKEFISTYLEKTEEEINLELERVVEENKFPSFLVERYLCFPNLEKIKQLLRKSDDIIITDPIDRDWWYDFAPNALRDIDTFAEDL